MALPAIGDGEQIGDGNTNEVLNVGRTGQSVQVAGATTTTLGFHGSSPTVQRSGADQAALTLTTVTNSSAYGLTTSTGMTALVALVVEIRAALVAKGLIKGSS